MSGAWDATLTQWLPEPLATHIAAEEETRFRRLVDAVCKASEAITDPQFALDNLQLGQDSVSWIAHVETCAPVSTRCVLFASGHLKLSMYFLPTVSAVEPALSCLGAALPRAGWPIYALHPVSEQQHRCGPMCERMRSCNHELSCKSLCLALARRAACTEPLATRVRTYSTRRYVPVHGLAAPGRTSRAPRFIHSCSVWLRPLSARCANQSLLRAFQQRRWSLLSSNEPGPTPSAPIARLEVAAT